MASPEQPLQAFIDFFEQNPKLFEPLEDIPVPEPDRKKDKAPFYEPVNDVERRLLLLIEDQQNSAVQGLMGGTFNPVRTLGTPGQALTVYRETLGRVLGKPLEGGLRVGIHTGVQLSNEFDDARNIFAVIRSDVSVDRSVTRLGYIYPALLSEYDKRFLDEYFFPVEKIPEILKPFLK